MSLPPVKALVVQCECGREFVVPITVVDAQPARNGTMTLVIYAHDASEGSEMDKYLDHDCVGA